MLAPTMLALMVDGCDLSYEMRGEGGPLLLINGTCATIPTWGSALEELERTRTVVALDRRGYAGSPYRPIADFRVHARDAAALVDHAFGEPCDVLGWSTGATVAILLALAQPELVRSLTLVEPIFHGGRWATAGIVFAVIRAQARRFRGRPREATRQHFRWLCSYKTGGNGFDRLDPAIQSSFLDHARNLFAELRPHPYGITAEAVRNSALASIDVPATLLVGELSDPYFDRIAGRMSRLMPALRTVTIPGAGHLVHHDNPGHFVEEVRAATDS